MTENIDLGLGLDSERIIEAARISRADAFIQSLPKGYETYVTEGAGNLSAGQRQLIAFARIIAHDPSVIILDEATANVDTETESLLRKDWSIFSRIEPH
jgi:ATP-binding cassette subfamily B multidrug efflux pump